MNKRKREEKITILNKKVNNILKIMSVPRVFMTHEEYCKYLISYMGREQEDERSV